MAELKIVSRKDFEAKIVANAWRDASYKKRLLKNPKAVVQNELQEIEPGVELPKDLNVAVHEESPEQYHLVLPRNPNDIAPGAIADEQLEAVAPQTVAVLVANINNVVTVTGPLSVAQVIGIAQIAVQVTGQVANVINVVVNQASASVA